ncbi:MAG: TRL-like family protein [Lentisphaeraceae bacterium]|nr:TRL-like family protein [Lentisphaeraceae bacterium]
MTKFFKVLVFSVIMMIGSGCAYTGIQMPLDTDFDETTLGSKEGKSSTHTVLFLVSWGDAGSKAAAEDGDVEVIRHADREIFSILFGLYTKVTTVVYGD